VSVGKNMAHSGWILVSVGKNMAHMRCCCVGMCTKNNARSVVIGLVLNIRVQQISHDTSTIYRAHCLAS
jgi:hypothetical protein